LVEIGDRRDAPPGLFLLRWRTLKAGGELNPKYPGGVEGQRARLESEGHKVVSKGQRLVVHEHERFLVALRA